MIAVQGCGCQTWHVVVPPSDGGATQVHWPFG
jgi:hypothetical protein